MRLPRAIHFSDMEVSCCACDYPRDIGNMSATLGGWLGSRKSRAAREIILDDEGYSRRWSGTVIKHDNITRRDDGPKPFRFKCSKCGLINVLGKHKGQLVQTLGRSEVDIRYLMEKEHGSQSVGHRGLVRQANPAKGNVAEGSWPPGKKPKAGRRNRKQGA